MTVGMLSLLCAIGVSSIINRNEIRENRDLIEAKSQERSEQIDELKGILLNRDRDLERRMQRMEASSRP